HITCSRLDSTRLRETMPELNVTETPNGVDIDYFHPTVAAQELNSLVFAGNLSWYPNSAAMLYFADHVWPLLRNAVPGIVMNLIGAHPPERLKALAASDPNFRVHGFVPDVRPHINSAAVYVCPIMDGGGTKLKVLDALAMGKPLVANPVACEGIEVVDGETVLFAERPADYVGHIATLLRNPSERMRMGARARSLVETSYSYAGIGRKLARAMEECVQASGHRPHGIPNP
ncbi:MAG: glycosyltransferase family 4 protein, partial [Chromatiales bacterium]